MRLFRRHDGPPVGLEIGSQDVKVLQLLNGPDGSTRAVLSRRPLPAFALTQPTTDSIPRDVFRLAAELARKMLVELPSAPRKVIACLPDGCVQLRTIRIPAGADDSPPANVDLTGDAIKLFPFDLSAARVQYLYAGRVHHTSGPAHEFYVAASPADVVAGFVCELDRAGIEIEAIDLAPCAVYRAIERRYATEQTVQAIIDVRELLTEVIIGGVGRIRLIRQISTGSGHLHQAISHRLGITPQEAAQLRQRLMHTSGTPTADREPVRNAVRQACRGVIEAMATEVAMCFRYYQVAFRGPQPRQILTSGQESNDLQIKAVLRQATGLELVSARLLDDVPVRSMGTHRISHPSGEWTLPLGLALRGNTPGAAATRARAA